MKPAGAGDVPAPPITAPDIERTIRMASPRGDDETVQGFLLPPNEASDTAPVASGRRAPPSSVDPRRNTAPTAPSGNPSFSTVAEMEGWPTQTMTGADLPDDEAPKTRIGSRAYREQAMSSTGSGPVSGPVSTQTGSSPSASPSAAPPPKSNAPSAPPGGGASARIAARPDGPVRTSQAMRVVVWRGPDGVYVAPHGTTVTAIAIDALLVALDPGADLSAWLSNK